MFVFVNMDEAVHQSIDKSLSYNSVETKTKSTDVINLVVRML